MKCFIMLCDSYTQEECLRTHLFGDRITQLSKYRTVEVGDWAFLLNFRTGELFGLFQAASSVEANKYPHAFGGKFGAQIDVRPIGSTRSIPNGCEVLQELGIINPGKRAPANPVHNEAVLRRLLTYFGEPEPVEPPSPPAPPPRASVQPIKPSIPEPKPVAPKQVAPEADRPKGFDRIAGLPFVKKFIREMMIEPTKNPELAKLYGLKLGGGLLLFGPPGTGKTLVAKATAEELDAHFEEITPSIVQGYPGQAEQRLENLFDQLLKRKRVVLFFDEAEALLDTRGSTGSTVMKRISPVLLKQFSRISQDHNCPFLIIAATNLPWQLDEAFLRPGRLEKRLLVGLPDETAIVHMLQLGLLKRPVEPSLKTSEKLHEIAKLLQSEGYTGADIDHVLHAAAMRAFQSSSQQNTVIPITEQHVLDALCSPSVHPDVIAKHLKWAKDNGAFN